MINDASVTAAVPAAYQATYFSMPSLIGVTATGGAATAGPVDFIALTNQGSVTRVDRWKRLSWSCWLA